MDVSVVLIEYNSLNDVQTCIQALKPKMEALSFEIIVSSNSNYLPSKQNEIRKDMPDLKWIFNQRNLGFAKGMNRGIACASGEAILISNVDVILLTSLKEAYEYLMQSDFIGMIGPQIIDANDEIQDSCREFMTPSIFITRVMKRILHKKSVLLDTKFNYDIPQAVDWIIGAFMLIKKSALEKVGTMDEHYFMYVEDMDLCKRLWLKELQVFYLPSLKVCYKGDRKSLLPIFGKPTSCKYTFHHCMSYARFCMKFFGRMKRDRSQNLIKN
ncbi:glycosyltransferase [Candidatus Omnitrophota bacterium]